MVTVGVVFHNEAKNLPALLASITTETAENSQLPIEFLFVNNCSTDSSVEIVTGWMAENSQLSTQIIDQKQNHMALARQQVLEQSQTTWVGYIDADATLCEGWSKSLVRTLSELEETDVAVGGAAHYTGQESWHGFARALADYFPLGRNSSQRVIVPHISTHNYFVRKEAALACGGFDPFFSRVGEDLDFNVRLRTLGQIYYEPNILVTHKLPQYQTEWFAKMSLYGRAQTYVFLKYKKGIPKEKFLPLICCLLLNWALVVYPMISFVTFSLLILIPRTQFFLMSFLFYGLGEFVGFFKYYYQKLFTTSPGLTTAQALKKRS